MAQRYDVIVVGARVAGSPTAMLLARAGLRVLLVDRARFPSDTVSTHQVQPLGVARLARWGLLDQLQLARTPATRSLRLDVGGVVVEGSFPTYEGVDALYSPRRTVLDRILVDAAGTAGADVRENFVVDELVWDAGRVVGIRGHERGGTSVTDHAALVVGADGKQSMVANATAARYQRRHPPITLASYAYWSGVPVMSGELYQRAGRAVAAFPTNDDLTMVYVAAPAAEFAAFRSDIEAHYLDTLDRCGDLGVRVRAGRRVERFRTTPRLPNAVRVPYGSGWALVGDAGLVMDPVSAQGIGNAFVAAELLATAVTQAYAGGKPLDAELGGYHRRRDTAILPMYDFTVRLAALAPDPAQQRLLTALAGRQAEIDRALGVFGGIVPLDQYFSARNMLRLLGPRGVAHLLHDRAGRPTSGRSVHRALRR